MITGIAALNKANRPNTGDDMRYPRPNDNRGGNPGGNMGGGQNVIPAFMPGQKVDIAEQLNMGFGGGDDQWMAYLEKIYSPLKTHPFKPSGPGGGGGGDVRPGQPQIPKDTKNPMVTRVTGANYPGEYVTGLAALRGRT